MLTVEVSRHSSAGPEAVWALMSDPTRMGEWSPECVASHWIGGATEAAVGARFRGLNRRGAGGWRRWSTTSTVTELEPGRRITWAVSVAGMAVADWGYEVQPEGTGSVVTERFVDRRGKLIHVVGGAVRGVADDGLEAHNRALMETTLERMCTAAEGAAV